MPSYQQSITAFHVAQLKATCKSGKKFYSLWSGKNLRCKSPLTAFAAQLLVLEIIFLVKLSSSGWKYAVYHVGALRQDSIKKQKIPDAERNKK